jgi:hypothetical protein
MKIVLFCCVVCVVCVVCVLCIFSVLFFVRQRFQTQPFFLWCGAVKIILSCCCFLKNTITDQASRPSKFITWYYYYLTFIQHYTVYKLPAMLFNYLLYILAHFINCLYAVSIAYFICWFLLPAILYKVQAI